MKSFEFTPVAVVESCYKEKFAIPRQPTLVPESRAKIVVRPEYAIPEAFDGLEESSHIWVQFVFHESMQQGWNPRVRPPRLGGNKRKGVFATRTTFRPNSIGLSVVKLDAIDLSKGVALEVSSIDLLDGTPVLDIKPYIPYSDAVANASHGFAETEPQLLEVGFVDSVEYQIIELQERHQTLNIKELIRQTLAQDPRPSYQLLDEQRDYGVRLLDFNLKWRYRAGDSSSSLPSILVTEIESI